jgi:hypothetical protein
MAKVMRFEDIEVTRAARTAMEVLKGKRSRKRTSTTRASAMEGTNDADDLSAGCGE